MTTASSPKGPPNDDTNITEAGSSSYSHEEEDDPFMFRSRKSYPQRNNRQKLNYRDLERGVYDTYEMRQSMWALGGPTLLEKNNRNVKESNDTRYTDDEDDDDDEMVVEQKDKSNDDTDQMHRRLWCICKKPWDHSRLMLRCDSCANWYHGDCIGVTKEQARVLEMNGDQFVCPPCQGTSQQSGMKPARSSDESIIIKRKRLDVVSPSDRKVGERNGNVPISKNITYSEPTKRPKTGIFFQRDPLVEPQIHCIVHGCSNWAKSGWIYCSAACIRRHINDTLQTIQRSKGMNNENPPSREDILLYENKTKKVLDRKLVPKVEDLCAWINQHPSYEIVKPALRQSILLTASESKSPSSSLQTGLVRPSSVINTTIPKAPPTPTSTKPKLSWVPTVSNTKPLPAKKPPVPIGRQTSTTPAPTLSSLQNMADIRYKVPTALYDKLIIRLEKSDEKNISNEDIRIIVDKIEEEMYRVYGKVDNSYKNKFRSLLANISNMNNNFFYKQILSKEITPKQIVAMKPEDMLPPEEKEKRKDEFEKEVQMIIKAEEQTAEEMARRAKMKVTRQGLVDNDPILPVFKQKEAEEKEKEPKSAAKTETKSKVVKKSDNTATSKPIVKTKKPVIPATDQKPTVKSKPVIETPTSNKDTTSSHGKHTFDINCSICANPTITKPSSPKPSPSIPTETIPSIIEPLPIKPVDEPPKLRPTSPIREELPEVSNPTFPTVDLDNDYIEPESPTGIDALLYDDDDDLNNISTHSRPSITIQQHPDSPGDNTDYLPLVQQSVRDDYNPLSASKPKTDGTLLYQPTPIARSPSVNLQWRGFINPPDAKIPCQSVRIYGESEYLIGDIPEQLGILGRLRLTDLWDYIRDSIAVRDVIILTVTSSNNNDNNIFSRYVDTMRSSGRAAVINKRTEPSLIRDMYVLAADIKDCPSNVLSSLSLPATIDSTQLFLVIIGSGKRANKSLNRPNENQLSNNLTYKPVSLQDSAASRDPRLLRNKDPRLGGSNVTETIISENASPSTSQPTNNNSHTKSKPAQYSTEDILKIMVDSLERIRHSSSTDVSGPIIKSTMEFLKSIGREDLYARFTDDLHALMSELQTPKEASSTRAVVVGDNLNEENMDVDEEQDEKHKKRLSISEYNDVDYRFLDQDMDHRMTKTTHENDHRKEGTRRSRFSDVMPSHRDADDRTRKSNLTEDGKDKRKTIIDNDLDFRTNDGKIASPR